MSLQIKSNQSSFIWWKKIPRLSQTQRWFTEHYSVDSVTATDMSNLNKVKKILRFEFSIYIWIGRQSFYRPFQGVESYEPGCAGCDQMTFSHGSIVSRHDAGCRRWRQTAYDLRLHYFGMCRPYMAESYDSVSIHNFIECLSQYWLFRCTVITEAEKKETNWF